MKKGIVYILMCWIVLTTLAIGQKAEWVTIDRENYSIDYPENWELNNSGQMNTQFIIFSPQESQADQFRENVNIVIQNLGGQAIDLDQFVEATTQQIKNFITDGKIRFSERKSQNGQNYHRLVYTGKQGQYNLKFEQRYWIKDGKAYVLTFTCEEDQSLKYKTTVNKILASFTIK